MHFKVSMVTGEKKKYFIEYIKKTLAILKSGSMGQLLRVHDELTIEMVIQKQEISYFKI